MNFQTKGLQSVWHPGLYSQRGNQQLEMEGSIKDLNQQLQKY